MDNDTMISELRDWAEVEGPGSLAALLQAAADRIEEMDERLAILGESLDAAESAFDAQLQEIGVREA